MSSDLVAVAQLMLAWVIHLREALLLGIQRCYTLVKILVGYVPTWSTWRALYSKVVYASVYVVVSLGVGFWLATSFVLGPVFVQYIVLRGEYTDR